MSPYQALIYRLTTRTIIVLISVCAVLLAAGIAWGGPHRFAVPSLAAAGLIPGGCYAWAALIGISGLTTLAGIAAGWRRRVVIAGTIGQGLWFAFFDVALWTTALQDDRTPLIGCWVYLMLAIVCGVLAVGGHRLSIAGRLPRGSR